MQLDFPVHDADNHLYESEDALTRHLPAADVERIMSTNLPTLLAA